MHSSNSTFAVEPWKPIQSHIDYVTFFAHVIITPSSNDGKDKLLSSYITCLKLKIDKIDLNYLLFTVQKLY